MISTLRETSLAGRGSGNHKRVYRVYHALRLDLPRRRTQGRVPPRVRRALVAPDRLNDIWALDFMHDALYGGRRFRTLKVLDEGNREGLAIEVGTSIPAARVVRVLDKAGGALRASPGAPARQWPRADSPGLCRLVRPARDCPVRHPAGQARAERLHRTVQPRTYREEVLDAYLWASTQDVQQLSDAWLVAYNEHRPHDALGRVPPLTCAARVTRCSESNYAWST